MIWQMMRIEQYKLSRHSLFWIEMALTALATLGMFGLLLWARSLLQTGIPDGSSLRVEGIDQTQATAMLTWPAGVINGLTVTNGLGAFLLVVLSGAATAQAYGWRSFQLWLSRGVPRPLLLLAKFGALALTAVFFTITAVFISSVAAAVFSQLWLDGVRLADVDGLRLGLGIVTTTLGLLPYAALGLLLAVSFRSTIVAISGGLAYVTLLEPLLTQLAHFLGGRWATAAVYLPGNLANEMQRLNQTIISGTAVPDLGVAWETAVLAQVLITLLLVSASLLLFQRQDLGG